MVGKVVADWFEKMEVSTFHLALDQQMRNTLAASAPEGHVLHGLGPKEVTTALCRWVRRGQPSRITSNQPLAPRNSALKSLESDVPARQA
jgi:hypothetical protein